MALGTTTLITSGGADSGQVNVDRFTVVLDASYPTGGYTGLAAKLTAAASRTPTIIAVKKIPAIAPYTQRLNCCR